MTARSVYEAALGTSTKTKVATEVANEMNRQELINQSGVNAGFTLQAGNAAYVAAVNTANAAKLVADYAAEVAKQSSIQAAREALRATDLGPL
jgi:hypothetical protein